jgi:hypothetical protein
MFVLHVVRVYATVLGLSGQLSGGFKLGYSSLVRLKSSYQCEHGACVA